MRIHELAKKYDVSSDELIKLLNNAGYEVKNHMSSVDYDMLSALDRHFSWDTTGGKKSKTKSKAKAKSKAKSKSKSKVKDLEDEPVSKATAKVKAKTKLIRKARPEPEPKPEAPVEAVKEEPAAKTKTKAKAKTKTTTKAKTKTKTKAKTETKTETAAKAKAKTKTTTKAKAKTATKTAEKEGAVKESSEKPSAKAKSDTRPAAEAKKKTGAAEPKRAEGKSAGSTKGKKEPQPRVKVVMPTETPTTTTTDEDGTKARRPAKGKGRRARKSPAEQEAQQKAVRESVRRTLAKLETTRKTKRKKTKAGDETVVDLPPVQVQEQSTVAMFARALGTDTTAIIEQLEALDIEAAATTELDRESIELIAEEMGRAVEIEAVYGETKLREEAQIDPSKLVTRAPVVTVMGHVDHGKTSILDYIRKSRVAAGEAGGITQHIGAYEVETPNGSITFVDTPGHEAFTQMRARGAQLTDIVVLVVAADDGVMPQTIEAINHTLAAGVPMIVAVNKIDLPGANPQNVKQQLMQHNVVVEAYGGEVVDVDVSAKTGEGIDRLLEMILLQAELQELKADPTARAQGVVVEVKKEEGRGIIVTVLVQQGTLKVGDAFVMGNEYGKVRSLVDHKGKTVKQAGPAMPVLVLGANGVPEAGDSFIAVKNEREGRDVSLKRQEAQRDRELQPSKAMTLEDLYEQIQRGELKELNIIVKGDTDGSVEALRDSLSPMSIEDVRVKVTHAGVGVVNESDVALAQSQSAIIIAFNTKVSPKAKEQAKRNGVDIRAYRIIYEVIEDVDKAMKGLLEPEFEERVLGKAEVRQLFRVSRLGTIAGSMVIQGSITRGANARVLRDDEVIYDGKVTSLKRFQDDVREVNENFECGIGVGYDPLQEGDIIEAYVVEEKVRVF